MFLKKLDKLDEAFTQRGGDVQVAGKPYVDLLVAFSMVVESCFGNEVVPGYEAHIQDFQAKYRALGITVTPKVFEKIFLIYLLKQFKI